MKADCSANVSSTSQSKSNCKGCWTLMPSTWYSYVYLHFSVAALARRICGYGILQRIRPVTSTTRSYLFSKRDWVIPSAVCSAFTTGTDVNTLDRCGRSPMHLALGRLRILHHAERYTSDQLKIEVIQVRAFDLQRFHFWLIENVVVAPYVGNKRIHSRNVWIYMKLSVK